MFIYIANKSSLSSSLDSIIRRVKFKHNNIFVNKTISIKLDLSINNIIYLYRLNFWIV